MASSIRTPNFDQIPAPEATKALPRGCGVCNKREDLQRCTACDAIVYCGRQHQSADRKAHRSICDAVKNQRVILASAEDQRSEMDSPWPIVKEQLRLASLLERIHSAKSVREQLKVHDRLMSLSPEPYRTGTLNAVLMTRLDEDQKAYNFLKYWVRYSEAISRTRKPPSPDSTDADLFEPVDLFLDICDIKLGKTEALGFLVTLTCIKVKLLLDLRAVNAAISSLGPQFSQEVLDLILQRVPQSPAVATNRAIMDGQGLAAEIAKMEAQVDALYKKVDETNHFFWPMLAYGSRDNLMIGSSQPQPGSLQEAQLLFLGQEYSWSEIPGARGVLEKKLDTSR